MKKFKKGLAKLLAVVLALTMIPTYGTSTVKAAGPAFTSVGGASECIYAQISGISDNDVTGVSYSGTMSGSLTGEDLQYLVRDLNGGVRVDIPGLKAGNYTLTVTTKAGTITSDTLTVESYDRSGYAHFNYTDGVGAYNDDGTIKDNAIILYVTEDNKNDVTITLDDTTVTGIGNILNSVGQDNGTPNDGICELVRGGKNVTGKANTNQDIIRKLALADRPLVVRIVGQVTAPEGLTQYDGFDYGGSVGDNGFMARMQSGKNVTIEGVGTNAIVDGWGFHFMCTTSNPELAKNFELRNITFQNVPEDCVGMEGVQAGDVITAPVERCWVHNCVFNVPHIANPAESDKAEGDGACDFKRGNYFTNSYCHYKGYHKTNLIGSSSDSLQYNVSMHHNIWENVESRAPMTRNSNIHVYNNFYYNQTSYCMDARQPAYIYSEYNLFYIVKNPMEETSGGAIKSYKDSFASYTGSLACVIADNDRDVEVNTGNKYANFDTNPAYSYIPSGDYLLQTSPTEARKYIYAYTGVLKENPIKPSDVTMSMLSIMPDGTTPESISSLPYEITTSQKLPGKAKAFTVGGAFDISVQYSSEEIAATGVLVNEAGESFLVGSGTVQNLPAGTYMIHSMNYNPGKNGAKPTFKDVTINSLRITQHDPDAHYHNYKSEITKAATCKEKGLKTYTCTATAGDCDRKTYTEEIPVLTTHTYGDYVVDKEATATETGSKHRTCSVCGKVETVTIPVTGSTPTPTPGGTLDITPEEGEKYVYWTAKSGASGIQNEAGYFIVAGNTSASSTTVGDKVFDAYLKSETATSIKFNVVNDDSKLSVLTGAAGSIKLYKNGTQVGSTTSVTGGTPYVVTGLGKGAYEIKKGSSDCHFLLISVIDKAPTTPDPVTYTVNLNLNGGTITGNKTSYTVTDQDSKKLGELSGYSEPTKDGFEFDGWYKEAEFINKFDENTVVAGDLDLYAKWNEVSGTPVPKYHIVFDANYKVDSKEVITKTSSGFAEGDTYTVTKPADPERDGYTFDAWYKDADCTVKLTDADLTGTMGDADITYYAKWEKKYDPVITTVNFDATTLPEAEYTAPIVFGDNIKITIDAKADSVVKADTSGGQRRLKLGTGSADAQNIHFDVMGAGSVTLNAGASNNKETRTLCLGKIVDGQLVKIGEKAIPASTAFVSYTFDLPAAGTYYIYSEEKQINFTGEFKVTYTPTATEYVKITFIADGKTVDTKVVEKDSDLVLPAAPKKESYVFKGWAIAADGEIVDFTSEKATENKTYYAVFEEAADNYYKITFVTGEDASGIDALDVDKRTTESISLEDRVPTKEGYTFLGWFTAAEGGEKVETIIPSVDGTDVTLYAQWEEISDSIEEKLKEAWKDVTPEDAASLGLDYNKVEDADKLPTELWVAGVSDVDYTGKAQTFADLHVYYNKTMLDPKKEYSVKYSANTNAGTATITITGKADYSGSLVKTFTINPLDISEVAVPDVVKAWSTSTTPQKAKSTVMFNLNGKDIKLVENKDFYYVWPKTDKKITEGDDKYDAGAFVNADDYTVRVIGKGNYTGQTSFKETISKLTLMSKVTVTAIPAQKYDGGKAITPEVTVKYSGKPLTKDVDYTVEYVNNTDIGTASVLIKGTEKVNEETKLGFIDTKTVTFKINGTNITSVKFAPELTKQNYVWRAEGYQPVNADKDSNPSLYVLTKNPETGKTDVVNGLKGCEKSAFAELSDGEEKRSYNYIYEYVGDTTNVGSVKINIEGVNAYFGKITKTYKIVGTAITSAKQNPDITKTKDWEPDADGNGKAIEPVGKADGKSFWVLEKNPDTGKTDKPRYLKGISKAEYETLTAEEQDAYDYTYEYVGDTTKVGTVKINIAGVNGFTGKKTVSYAIKGINISTVNDVQIKYADEVGATIKVGYDKAQVNENGMVTIEPKVTKAAIKATTKTSEVVLTENKDFTVSYLNNNKNGTATVVLTGINGYFGTKKISFTISQCDLAVNANVVDADKLITVTYEEDATNKTPSFKYTKSGVKPVMKLVNNVTGEELVLNKDYTVAYTNNNQVVTVSDAKNAKNPTVTVTGKGKYKGKVVANFNIEKANLSQTAVTAKDMNYASTAGKVTSAVTVTDKNNVKLATTDYEKPVYTYVNATTVYQKVGTAYTPVERAAKDTVNEKDIVPVDTVILVTVKAKADSKFYEGTQTGEYRVVAQNIANATVKVNAQTFKNAPIIPEESDITVTVNVAGAPGKASAKETLKLGKDYKIVEDSLVNNVKKGTAKMTIEGIGNYSGTKQVTFTINAKSLFYLVSYNKNVTDGSVTGTMTLSMLSSNQKVKANTYKRPGYVFKGWSYTKDPEGNGQGVVAIENGKAFKPDDETSKSFGYGSSQILYAVWEKQ